MSIKIYWAYRTTAATFSSVFLPAYRRYCFKKAAERVKELVAITPGAWRTPKVKLMIAFKKIEKASISKERSLNYDIDCSLNIWLHGKYVYSIPYGEQTTFGGFRMPAGTTDYSYWNNVDRPSHVTSRAWRQRERTWEEVCLGDWNASRLVHNIVDFKTLDGLHDICKLLKVDYLPIYWKLKG